MTDVAPRLSGRRSAPPRRKRVLIMSAYFVPESAAYIHLMTDFIQELDNRGFEVEVLSPVPTRGVTDSTRREYTKKGYERIGIHSAVRRFWLPRERGGAAQRAIRYLLQNIYQALYGITHRYDLLFLHSTPPTNGVMGGVLRKLKRKPFIYNVQDVFPDSLVNAGMATEGSLGVRIGRAIESFTYANADRLVVINRQIEANLREKGVDGDKLSVIYNWVDDRAVRPVRRTHNRLFDELSLDMDDFIVTYAGNVGIAQGIEVLVRAASLLSDEEGLHFVIMGSGVCLESCKKLAEDLHLANITFAPMQDASRVSEVYSLGDASLVSCKSGFGECGMPSKTCSIMATETPVIASFDLDSELASIVESNDVGVVVPAGDSRKLADAILELKSNRTLARACGRNGRSFLKDHMSKRKCCNELADLVESYLK